MNSLQESALKEASNIGAGHAASALSQLMGRHVSVHVPGVRVASPRVFLTELDPQTLVVGSYLKVLSDANGSILFLLAEDDAYKLVDLLLNQVPGSTSSLGDMEQSALKETGLIVGASYLNALGEIMHRTFIPSVPSILMDRAEIVFARAFEGKAPNLLIGIRNELVEATTKIRCHLLFLPEADGLPSLLSALGFDRSKS